MLLHCNVPIENALFENTGVSITVPLSENFSSQCRDCNIMNRETFHALMEIRETLMEIEVGTT